MNDIIASAIVIGVIFLGIAKIVKTFTDYRLKRRLIELGHIDEKVSNILSNKEDNYFNSLKWGMIIFFGGLGLIILEFIPYDTDSPFPYGFEAVFIATGFLLYFMLVKKEMVKS